MSDFSLRVMARIHSMHEARKLKAQARITAELLKGALGG